MFFRVVILVFAVTCCTVRMNDVSDRQSAWERSGKFEDDIVLTDEQITEELTKPTFLWWNKTVPFVIGDVFTDDERNTILLVIEDFNKETPIIFKKYDPLTDRDYISITGEDSGCWSYVGRRGGRQQLNLQRGEFGCMTKGKIIHELLQALRFWHQHSVTDRDDFVTINLKNITEDVSDRQSAWERRGNLKGGTKLTDEQTRNGVKFPERRWPNKTVPFVIDDVYTDDERNKILLAILEFFLKTSIRFKEYDPLTDKDYINITTRLGLGCSSYLGRIGGNQFVNLERPSCISHGIIIHVLLNALGFGHQHSASDRDDYVTINWDNIEPGMERNFDKYDASCTPSFGVPYDYTSIMHFGAHAFSRNGQPTIVPKDPNATIGQTDGFSEKDILKLELMYKTEENSSYSPRSQFITLIIITLNVLTHLQ